MIQSLITATVVQAHLKGSDAIFFHLLFVSSKIVMLFDVLLCVFPPIITGGEVFGTKAVFQYGE